MWAFTTHSQNLDRNFAGLRQYPSPDSGPSTKTYNGSRMNLRKIITSMWTHFMRPYSAPEWIVRGEGSTRTVCESTRLEQDQL